MIADFIESILSGLIGNVFNILDFGAVNEFSESLDTIDLSVFFEAVSYFSYFLDGVIVKLLINLEIGWVTFKTVWAIALRVKSFVPTVSST